MATTPSPPPQPRLEKNATPAQAAAHATQMKTYAIEEQAYRQTHAMKWAKWRPDFSRYNVVVSNYNGEPWYEEVQDAFVAFVHNGGGFVSYHAANNCFPTWPEYNQMIGLNGWRNQDKKSKPYLRFRDSRWTKDPSPRPRNGHGTNTNS